MSEGMKRPDYMDAVDDLDADPGAIGGAMSKWPIRAIRWTCRDMRAHATDDGAIAALLGKETDQLRGLIDFAESQGIDVSQLRARTEALEETDPAPMKEAIGSVYRRLYGNADDFDLGGGEGCPFEEEGMHRACWRCPLGGKVLDGLVKAHGTYPPEDR